MWQQDVELGNSNAFENEIVKGCIPQNLLERRVFIKKLNETFYEELVATFGECAGSPW